MFLIYATSCLLWTTPISVIAQQGDRQLSRELDAIQKRSGMPGGIRKMTPGNWGLMMAEVGNPSDKPKKVLSLIYFDADPGMQFGRRIWIPAQSSRKFWIPVFIPEDIIPDKNRRGEFVTANANVLLIDQSGASERIIRSDGRQLSDQSLFSIDTGKPITVQISDSVREDSKPIVNGFTENQIAAMALKCMRVSQGLGESIPNLSVARAPIAPALLESADQMIIRGNRLAFDAPGRTAVRQWVQAGGKLWIMLDTMNESTVRKLLGDACSIKFVDRVGLVNFQSIRADSTSPGAADVQEHESPIDFVRTIIDDCDLLMTINGWPSVFQKNFGHGTILFSTIGARALVRAKTADQFSLGVEPRSELNIIGNTLFEQRNAPIVPETALAKVVERNIGYRVPGRSFILLILGAFCLGLLTIGIWLAKSRQLGQLVWIAPVTALMATVPLVVMGATSKRLIPETVSHIQFVEAPPGGDDLYIRGLAGVFQNQKTDHPFKSDSSSLFAPDRTGIKDTWRMVWEDLDDWQWENVSMPSGLRLVPYSTTMYESDLMRVFGSFDADGFVGNLENPLSNLRDAIVASSTHVSLGIEIDGQKLSGPSSNSLEPGRYTSDSLLDDEQMLHQDVYRKMMDFDLARGLKAELNGGLVVSDSVRLKSEDPDAILIPKRKYPSLPSLLVWADAIDPNFRINQASPQNQGSALVVLPIQFLRPPAGENIRIPSVFLPYDAVVGPGNEGLSIAYDRRVGTWQNRSIGSKSTIRFQLPKCVLPFEPESANLKIKINAPKRAFDCKSGRLESLVDVGSTIGPTGLLDFTITDPAGLQLDENGGLHVRIVVGELARGNGGLQVVEWKIDYVELQVDGKHVSGD